MLPLRLVFDTNGLVSAALTPTGLQRTAFVLAITKPARLYVSAAILEEYARSAGAAEAGDSDGRAAAATATYQESELPGCA